MTADIALEVFLKWGLPGLEGVVIVWLIYLVSKYRAAFTAEVAKLHDRVDSQSGACRFHQEYQGKTDERLAKIELTNAATDRDMKTLFTVMGEMKADIKSILHHFAGKGMDA